jgi:RimJ/RimL family protein N-acetyltransferase
MKRIDLDDLPPKLAALLAGAEAGEEVLLVQNGAVVGRLTGGAPVGLANLARIDPASRRCEWAYYLAEASTRGRGLGSRIEYIVLRHVFETLGLNKLWCEVLLENEGVWKLHESFGFVREALYRQHVFKGGRFQDVVGLGMLASDWAGARPAIEARLRDKGHDPEALAPAP